MKILSIIILFSLCTNKTLCAQQSDTDTIKMAYVGITSYEIPLSSIRKMLKPSISEFQGAYHFGESEGESTLTIILSNGKLFANESSYIWDDSVNGWKEHNEHIKTSYKNGQVKMGATHYDLYVCVNEESLVIEFGEKGLVSEFFEKEEGKMYHYFQFNAGVPVEIIGKYPEASMVELTMLDLKDYSKQELKIIRNEIFARNGHQFKKGGKMDTYFSNQKWYKANIKEPIQLSLIEKHNINLIAIKENE